MSTSLPPQVRRLDASEQIPFLRFHACLYHPGKVRGFEPTLTYSAHWIAPPGLDGAVRRFLGSERAAIRPGLPGFDESGLKDA